MYLCIKHLITTLSDDWLLDKARQVNVKMLPGVQIWNQKSGNYPALPDDVEVKTQHLIQLYPAIPGRAYKRLVYLYVKHQIGLLLEMLDAINFHSCLKTR